MGRGNIPPGQMRWHSDQFPACPRMKNAQWRDSGRLSKANPRAGASARLTKGISSRRLSIVFSSGAARIPGGLFYFGLCSCMTSAQVAQPDVLLRVLLDSSTERRSGDDWMIGIRQHPANLAARTHLLDAKRIIL